MQHENLQGNKNWPFCNSSGCCLPSCLTLITQLAKNVSIQKDWERMWEKRRDIGRGLSVDSFASLFWTLTIIKFIIKNVVDS